jgi:hypothetical protein
MRETKPLRSLLALSLFGMSSIGAGAAPPNESDAKSKIRPAVVKGTQLIVTKADGTKVTGAKLAGATIVGVGPDGSDEYFKIVDVEKDPYDPAGERYLYSFLAQNASGEWVNPCLPDDHGVAKGFPIAGTWDTQGRHLESDRFSITCTYAPMGKCVRWGYAFWKNAPDGTPLWDYYQACYRMVRADYCGNGRTHTADGMHIDLFDRKGMQKPDDTLPLEFEAAWSPEGALCVAHTRIPRWKLADLQQECPEKLKGRLGDASRCNYRAMMKDPRALIFNKSARP